ncbi:MAG: 3'(2'),5'-bisphosphate nucleotidase CysQ [Rickettsiaceae bacterium]
MYNIDLENPNILNNLADKIIRIAQDAGTIILKHYKSSDLTLEYKKDGSIVTIADIESSNFIIFELLKIMPNIPVISEESQFCEKQNNHSVFWLVDPIDGTEGFVSRNDDFVINICLIKDGKSILGVVHSPIKDYTYYGGLTIGSKLYKKNKIFKIKAKSIFNDGVIVLLYHELPYNLERDSFLKTLKISNIKYNADMLRFCRVSEGEVDLYICFEETKEWDIAAGHAILKGAGGNIIDLNNNEIKYGKPNFINPPFLAHGKNFFKTNFNSK